MQLVFDIGAHLGEDSSYYLKRGYNVVAFECSPNNIEYLSQRFALEIRDKQLQLETKALVSGGGEGKLIDFFVDDISVWGTVHKDWTSRNRRLGSDAKTISVETMDPESIYRTYGVPFYMKIDIEGSDVDVLKSLFKVETNMRPKYVSIESSKTSFKNLQEELRILSHLGYTKFAAVNQERIKKQTCWISESGERVCHYHERDSSGPFGDDLKVSWKTIEEVTREYRFIFLKYRLFGDDGLLAPRKLRSSFVRSIYSKILSAFYLSPGWYDTHATK